MKVSKSVAELQREHVVLELECIYRMGLGEPHALLESLRPPEQRIRMRNRSEKSLNKSVPKSVSRWGDDSKYRNPRSDQLRRLYRTRVCPL
jgi:hypothetical protein